jgi:hypothetical protein
MDAVKKKYVLLRGIDRGLHAQARTAAFREGTTLTRWIFAAIEERLARTTPAPPPAPTPAADTSA